MEHNNIYNGTNAAEHLAMTYGMSDDPHTP